MNEYNKIGVSIIIPVYNREKYLRQAIDSVLNQEFKGNIELIVSDDGSTDSSLEIAKSYDDDRIIILEKDASNTSQGAAAARNRALNVASMPFVCFLDSDDFQKENFLTLMTKALMTQNDLGFVFCRTEELIEEADSFNLIPWTKKRVLKLDTKYLGLTGARVINTNCFLFRKEVFDVVGVFNEKYSNSEDADLWIRIGEHFAGTFLDYWGVVRRTHKDGQLTNNQSAIKKACAISVAKEAIKRTLNRDRNKYRIYRLNNIILSNQDSSTKKLLFDRFILAVKYPIPLLKHLYLLVSKNI